MLDEALMKLAKEVSKKSNDPNTKVGSIIMKENNLLSMGFNSEPDNFDKEEFPWAREGKYLETKYPFVCHSELNAICNYSGPKSDLEGTTIYVTLFPCNECAKLIIQTGIKEVVYESDKYADTESTIASKMLFDKCGIKYRQVILDKEKTLIKK